MKKKYLEGSFEFAEELCKKYPETKTKTFMEIYSEDTQELTSENKEELQQYTNITCPVGLWVIAKEDLSEDKLESLNSLVDELYEKGDA
ncbi:MAG: hypothetical protein KAU95_01785, partial [Candidatus Aenigmarchaeota archaeon]|nr:hypothetical protein [Candidatus Aenigmarchaeota archaeon]